MARNEGRSCYIKKYYSISGIPQALYTLHFIYIFLKHGALDFSMTDKSHDYVLELQKQNSEYCGHMHLNFKGNPEALNSHDFLLILGNMISMHYKQWLFIRDFHM